MFSLLSCLTFLNLALKQMCQFLSSLQTPLTKTDILSQQDMGVAAQLQPRYVCLSDCAITKDKVSVLRCFILIGRKDKHKIIEQSPKKQMLLCCSSFSGMSVCLTLQVHLICNKGSFFLQVRASCYLQALTSESLR